jgi:hypothetical protein
MDHNMSADFVVKTNTMRDFRSEVIVAIEFALRAEGVHCSQANEQARQIFVALDAFGRVYERPDVPIDLTDAATAHLGVIEEGLGVSQPAEQPTHEWVIPNATEPLVEYDPTTGEPKVPEPDGV